MQAKQVWAGASVGAALRKLRLQKAILLIALLACLKLATPFSALAQVTGSGTVGTIPVWKTNTTNLGDTSPINGIASASLFITGPAPWIDVTAFGAKADSTTDNATAIQNAINACPPSSAAMTSAGCTVFFPYGGTGNYLIKSSIKVNSGSTLQDGVRLVGECTSLGTGSTRGTTAPLTCSTIIANASFTSSDAMLVVGGFVSGGTIVKTHGFVLQDIGFSDTSANNSAVPGAIHLIEVEDFSLLHPACFAFASTSPNGYCMQFDGGGTSGDFTQFGVVVNPAVEKVRYPIITNDGTSEVNVYGGELDCTGVTGNAIPGSIGFNLGATHNPPSMKSNGEWGIYGTHVLNCATGLSGYQANVLQWYGIVEIPTNASTSGTIGINLTGSGSGGNGGGSTIAGSINNYETCVQLALTSTSAPPDVRIMASLTPNGTNGVALNIDPSVIGKTLILAPENYAGVGGSVSGTASGSTFGSDVVISSVNNPRSLLTTIPNGTSSATQTVVSQLAKLSGGTAVIASTSDTQGVVGIVVNGAGITGSAQIASVGQANCVFDGGTAAGDYVTISSTIGGDCHDYGSSFPPGQVLGRVLSTNASAGTYAISLFGPGTSAPVPNFRNTVTLQDEFFATGTSSGTIGELGWSAANFTPAKIAGIANHPGILQMTTTGMNVIAQNILGTNPNSTWPILSLNNSAFSSVFILSLDPGSSASSLKIRAGFVDNSGIAAPMNGIYFEASTGTSGTWEGFTVSAGTSSTTTGGPTLNTSFHTLEIRNDGINNVSFWYDGTLVGTLTSHIPTVALQPFFQITTTNSTNKSLDIDAFQFTMAVNR